MLTSRRLASHSANRLAATNTSTATTTTTASHHRVYFHKAKPPRGKSQHVRSYQSSLKNPYFVNTPIITPGVFATPAAAALVEAPKSFIRRGFQWYSDKLSTHPLLTKSLTGAFIAAAGDILCQAGLYSPKEEKDGTTTKKEMTLTETLEEFVQQGWDYRRSFHFFILGLTFVAPTSHYWYGGLAKHSWTKGQSMVQISKRVALDQFVWTPVFFVIWLGGFWSMESGDVNGPRLQQQLTDHLPEVMVANWILWIPAQYLNFYACPVKFQVLFVNLIELGWNAYLSFACSGGGHGNTAKVEDDSNNKNKMGASSEEDEHMNRGELVKLC